MVVAIVLCQEDNERHEINVLSVVYNKSGMVTRHLHNKFTDIERTITIELDHGSTKIYAITEWIDKMPVEIAC